MHSKERLDEIEQWRQHTNSSHFQLDWLWIERYRQLVSYDAYWWSQAGPFTEEEQKQWHQIFSLTLDEEKKEQLGHLLTQSRQREVNAALAEQRQPRLLYPALAIEEVRRRIADFLELDADIRQNEPNEIVRTLYHGAIEDELSFVRLIEATHEGNTERFKELNEQLFPKPTDEEMAYALSRLRRLIQQGFEQSETRELSQNLAQFLTERFHISLDLSFGADEPPVVLQQDSSHNAQFISPQAAKCFFEAILCENGYEGWQVIIDENGNGTRIESGLRQLFIQNTPVTVDRIRHLIAHELAGHVARSAAGEQSLLGLLGIGTQDYSTTEEGLALYQEREATTLSGQPFSDTSLWLGTLAMGLASGVIVPPQTFLSFSSFFEQFFLLHRRLWKPKEDIQTAQEMARKQAIARSLRTYRGVPDLEKLGVYLGSDVVYLRGLWEVEQAVAKDKTVLTYLSVGKLAYKLLPVIQQLELVPSPQPLRGLAYDPQLDTYILSFEQTSST